MSFFKSSLIDIDKDKDLIKFKIYTKKIVPNLIKQICI